MNFDEYQEVANRTALAPFSKISDRTTPEFVTMGLICAALALAGEAGEFAQKVYKLIRDKQGRMSSENVRALLLELGDCAWEVAQGATELGAKLQQVADLNLEKLADRHERSKITGSGDDR